MAWQRLFLAAVGAAYVGLGLWCAFMPARTSKTVGFTLQPGLGQSEFLTVYGGLEVALGILFLVPLVRPSETSFVLLACVIVHGCLVLFRTAGFIAFSELPTTTYYLATVEWVIFLAAAALFWKK